MGCCYRHGDGVKKDAEKAVQWYEKASALGSVDSQISLGYMYERGCGVKKDLKRAAEWYKKALENGEEAAAYMLSKKKFAKIVL